MTRNVLGYEFDSAARLSKRPGSMWNCLWWHALKKSPGINRKSRVSYPGTGFLSCAKWPFLTKNHYNGLIKSLNQYSCVSTPFKQFPLHTPHAATQYMPAFMQLHLIAWHWRSPSLKLQQIILRKLSVAIWGWVTILASIFLNYQTPIPIWGALRFLTNNLVMSP